MALDRDPVAPTRSQPKRSARLPARYRTDSSDIQSQSTPRHRHSRTSTTACDTAPAVRSGATSRLSEHSNPVLGRSSQAASRRCPLRIRSGSACTTQSPPTLQPYPRLQFQAFLTSAIQELRASRRHRRQFTFAARPASPHSARSSRSLTSDLESCLSPQSPIYHKFNSRSRSGSTESMAPPNSQKRVKGTQIHRPFVYGTTAKLFDPVTNPKPEDTPADHTHSWTVFVKGVDDTDITYWLRKVQFKLHESIPNPLRTIENVKPGEMFAVHETGWGEFEISIKMYFTPESVEKPQMLYHHLRLHPYGDTEEAKEVMRQQSQIIAWTYEEVLFNEPYEQFYEILTSPTPTGKGAGGKGKGAGGKGKATKKMGGGMVGSVGERTALIPQQNRPGQPFSQETEKLELKRIMEAQAKVDEMIKELSKDLKSKEELLKSLKS